MKSLPCTSGIYQIRCLITGKIYIGSAQNLQYRWHKHSWMLRHNRHPNKYLQRAWNKHGEENFRFEILEFVMPWSILDREQYWLDKLSPFGQNGFNGNRLAGKSPTLGVGHRPETIIKLREAGKKSKGRKRTPEQNRKLSESLRGHKLSDETRAKIGRANKGKTKGRKQSPEFVERRIANNRGTWELVSPDGQVYIAKGLTVFCNENGLDQASMSEVASGKRKHHKGWRCKRLDKS